LYRFFIGIHHGVPAFELQEYDLSQSSLRESIEYDIVATLPDEDHILRCVWEVRECGEDLLIDFTEYAIARSFYCVLSDSLVFMERHDPHDKNPDHESDKSTENENKRIHSKKQSNKT
jgi:hypothetical protein